MEKLRQAAGFLAAKLETVPDTAVVLGSGLGGFTTGLENKKEISYAEIPHFPMTSVKGHSGRFIVGSCGEKRVIVLSGRVHFYEGFSMSDVVFYVRVLKLLGVKNLIITNAAGAINEELSPGDLSVICDHIKFCGDSPLIGKNLPELGERFADMSDAYNSKLLQLAERCARQLDIPLKRSVYAYMTGPNYETPAEIRMLKILGADTVGMSTVPEIIAARHCGVNSLAISCITNMAAGITAGRLSHEEVFAAADSAGEKMGCLIKAVLNEI